MNQENFRMKASYLKRKLQESLPSKLRTGLNNLNRNYLQLSYFKISQVLERLNFVNDFFNAVYFTQIDLEQTREFDKKILDSGLLLLDKLRDDLDYSVHLFEQSKSKNVETLSSVNSMSLSDPRYAKKILLDIPGFYFDNEYFFNLNIEGIESLEDPNSTKIVNMDTLPFKYGGFFKEKISLENERFVSSFKCLSTSDIIIYDKDNNKTNYTYKLVDGNIVINTNEISNDGLVLEYTPIFEESEIDVDMYITKINLSTNFKGNNKKNIIFIGDSNV